MERFCSTKSVIAGILLLSSNLTGFSQAHPWFSKIKQIKVLESTKQDVEKVLGSPRIKQIRRGNGSETIDYEFNLGRLEISYSTGKCSAESNPRGYNVEKDVVRGFIIFLFEPVKIAELELDLKDFEIYIEPEAGAWIYSNDTLGIQYSGDKKTITSINFDPPERFDDLRCKNMVKTLEAN